MILFVSGFSRFWLWSKVTEQIGNSVLKKLDDHTKMPKIQIRRKEPSAKNMPEYKEVLTLLYR